MEAEEDKIVEHAKEAIHSLTDKKKSWKEKIGSFLWEILIIIIAVNLTIWFHSWSDKRHERQLEKEFLISTRKSLVQDTTNIRNYIKSTTNLSLVYLDSVLSQINRNKKIDAQYVDSHIGLLVNDFGMNFNYGIYQSFSSAGNLRLIENQKLLSDIISLYSNDLPNIKSNLKYFIEQGFDVFQKYIGLKTGIDNSRSTKLSTIIYQPEVIYYFQMRAAYLGEIINEGEKLINQIAAVIQEIDQELKEKFNYDTSKRE